MADISNALRPNVPEDRDAAPPSSGLRIALDICLAPKAALINLREHPTWVWALVIAAGLGMIGTYAVSPAVAHALQTELATKLAATPQVMQMPADQRDAFVTQQVRLAQSVTRFSFLLIPFGLAIGCAFQALVMLVANAIGRGDGTFKKFWALAVNAAIIGTGLSSLVLMLIVLIRGAGGFGSSSEITGALPGLGMLVPAGAKAASAFFSVFNIFAIWDMALLAAGMMIVARLARTTAIVTAAIILAATGLLPLIGATLQK